MSTESGGFERFVPGGKPPQAPHDAPVATIGRHEKLRFNWKAVETWGLKDVETVTYYLDADTRRLGLSFDESDDLDDPSVYKVTDYDECGEVLSHVGSVLRSLGIENGDLADTAHCLLRYDDEAGLITADLAPVFAVQHWEIRRTITPEALAEIAELIEEHYREGKQYVRARNLTGRTDISKTRVGHCCGELVDMGSLEVYREAQKRTFYIPDVFSADAIATRVGAGGEA